MSANALNQVLAKTNTSIEPILKMLRVFNEGVETFNADAALLKFGRQFHHVDRHPTGLRKGALGQCFRNCTSALMQYVGDPHPPFLYAEGYAFDAELGMPFAHAWLVDPTGRAIDLTWRDPEHAIYFGITFKPDFLIEAMRRTEVYGVLFNPHIEDCLFANAATFASTLSRPGLPGLPCAAIT